jgi:hypothetical protein
MCQDALGIHRKAPTNAQHVCRQDTHVRRQGTLILNLGKLTCQWRNHNEGVWPFWAVMHVMGGPKSGVKWVTNVKIV